MEDFLEQAEKQYLTDEQKDEIEQHFLRKDFASHMEDTVETIRKYLIENKTMDAKMRKVFSLYSALKRLNQDEELLENRMLSPGFIYYPFVMLGIFQEVGVRDIVGMRINDIDPYNVAWFKDNHKNEA
ncbi:MAG: hypothetical protein K6B65_04320 [Bacilli bacterium]|nr:hypothetical protein [Bacilli bacterium]